MKPTVKLFIGARLSGHEARVLRTLCADMEGTEALIFANFLTSRQIDFVVVTKSYAALVELKNFHLPIFGSENGRWSYENTAGRRITGKIENPYQQVIAQKYSLSDAMADFQKHASGIPLPKKGAGYVAQFDAYVCIYPEIHPNSQVVRGDHKVAVASYKDVASALKSKTCVSSWTINDWERFACEHLGLTPCTLEEAIDRNVADAWDSIRVYKDRIKTVIADTLPPLYSVSDSNDYGSSLVESLRESKNFFLVGPSGSTKTFHLHHLAASMACENKELPVLLEAKTFAGGDLWSSVVRPGTAPFFKGEPRDLFDAAKTCGLRIVLMVDALNECPPSVVEALLSGIQGLAVQYDCRVVFSSQREVVLPGDLRASRKTMLLPELLHKRSIYAYHAKLIPSESLDRLCASFTNAYDLTVAGRCHGDANELESRTELYDRYVHYSLPHNTSGLSALLRSIASEMAATLSLAWSRHHFELVAERFAIAHGLPLTALDELRRSRVVTITGDTFAFEHELLFDYFRAESLRRDFPDIQDLALQLARPRNRDLIELVLPKLSNQGDMATIFTSVDEPTVLSDILRGSCGSKAKAAALKQCAVLFSEAAADLQHIRIHCHVINTEEGKQRLVGVEVQGHRQWSTYASLLCASIALNVGDSEIRQRFLELLALTESALQAAANTAASETGLKPHRVWEEVIRSYGLLQRGRVDVPCCAILQHLRSVQMFPRYFRHGLPIRDALRDRVSAQPANLLTLLVLIEDLRHWDTEPVHVRDNLALVQLAWSSGVYVLRSTALLLMRSMRTAIEAQGAQLMSEARGLLESFDTNDVFANTDLLETLAAYDALEPPVSVEAALEEMRSLIVLESKQDMARELAMLSDDEPHALLARRAYGCLATIFEDVFQGVYYEAYELLSLEEKSAILRLAGSSNTSGMFTEWVLAELLKYGDRSAVHVFERFAAEVEAKTVCPQEAVASFVLGVEGCAKWGGVMPEVQETQSGPQQAWLTVGEVIYLLETNGDNAARLNELWKRFAGDLALSAGDVLYQLSHSGKGLREQKHDLVIAFQRHVKPILERCIRHRESLPTLFNYGGSRDASVVRYLIRRLGQIGDGQSKTLLLDVAEDPEFGKDAVAAAELIELRLPAHRANSH